MKQFFRRYHNRITAMLLAALTVYLCSIASGCTDAGAKGPDGVGEIPESLSMSIGIDRNSPVSSYAAWLSENYSSDVFTRQMWLNDLMKALGQDVTRSKSSGVFDDEDLYDCSTLFLAAYDNGILDGSAPMEPYAALTRRYVATTLVKALGYNLHDDIYADDLYDDDGMMKTAVYLGYFVPDDDLMVYPEAQITEKEYDSLLDEVGRYVRLRGKRLLSFGDSIMYGNGNNGEGIADMIGEKYGMIVTDYAVSGATFGRFEDRSHIPDQIKASIKAGDKADLILIDGGSNDMVHVEMGTTQSRFNEKTVNEDTFAGGMEYSLWLLQNNWKGTPILYVRAHNMYACKEATEQEFGEFALSVMEKWKVPYVDIYSDTNLNTRNAVMCERYTAYSEYLGQHDSVHPNALGYAKYYLPLVSDKVYDLLTKAKA